MENKIPDEYENVLVTSPEGMPIIAHRNGSRWYGYTLMEWLTFEPTEFMSLEDIFALRAENARLKERCEALEGLVEALTRQADVAAQSARFALHSSWENEQYRGICQTVQTARAKLTALGE